MNLEEFKNILLRYLEDKLSEEEKNTVDSWYDEVSSGTADPFTDEQHKAIVKEAIFAAFPPAIQATKKQARVVRLRWISIAASVLIFGISGLLIYQRSQPSRQDATTAAIAFTQISTRPGEQMELQLPDHSTITLNGNTQVRYHEQEYLQSRKIYLDKGEAFFNVQRDTIHPFSIETGALTIAVLGTYFNVNNSEQSKNITIDVKTGRVQVGSKINPSLHILTAGKSLQYDKGQENYKLYHTNADNADIWTRGGILMSGANFQELQELIYNRYGLILRSDSLDTGRFSYSLLLPQVKSVDQLLHMICHIHQINFRREGNEIILHH
ncbi:FecR family protein [Sphingobacterium anhuiense]|uniref:FecR family protein n=1 Tax=Sphingobacterium anhuiense TaxID=493780 RepID=A0ABW5YXS2_9SPHI